MNWKAVITGDIVGSTKLSIPRRKTLYDAFLTLSSILKGRFPGNVTYDLSNFRGDSWQLFVNNPQKSLEVSLFIRTFIRFHFQNEGLDTRVAIGIGSINFVPIDNISAGDGPAYSLSGHTLESLTSERMGLSVTPTSHELLVPTTAAMIKLLDHIITFWNAGQNQAVFLALNGLKQREIAKVWLPRSITQATVSHHLQAAGWVQVQECLQTFEKVTDLLMQNG